jgi:hypothetical protein
MSNKAGAVLLRYRPANDSASKTRHHHAALQDFYCHYLTVSADSRYNVQISATSEFASSGSFLRMYQLPANTRHPKSGCILHVYWLAADTRDEDKQSTGLRIGRLPIPLTLQQPEQRKIMEHLANQEAYLACTI